MEPWIAARFAARQKPVLHQQGALVVCTDERTGMQILERKHPTIPAQPGKPEKRVHECIRRGARCLIASFVVPTGKVVWDHPFASSRVEAPQGQAAPGHGRRRPVPLRAERAGRRFTFRDSWRQMI